MDTSKIQEVYTKQREAEDKKTNEHKSMQAHIQSVSGLDAVQRAVLKSAIAIIEHRDQHEPKVTVKNFPKSVKTPDINKVVSAIEQMSKDLAPDGIDFSPVIKALEGLKAQVAKLPTKHPIQPKPLDTVSVKNLSELKPLLTGIDKAIKSLKLDPKINVAAPKVTVPELDISGIENAIRENSKEDELVDLDDYRAVIIDNDSDIMQYIGFVNIKGEWYIICNDLSNNSLLYSFGKSDFPLAWENHIGMDYRMLNEAVAEAYGEV